MNDLSELRILDVNFNRAAEGLRTLEDIARVVREDFWAAQKTKLLRHSLGNLATNLPRLDRLAARAVHSDAGTSLTNASESSRSNWSEIVTAACERVTQSLRVIEEVSKITFPILAAEVKQLRYQAYDALAEVEQRLIQRPANFDWPSLYLLIDCALPKLDFVQLLSNLKIAGVGLFQIRDKQADSAKLLEYSRAAVEAIGPEAVIVNDRLDIALASGAGGVHVGQEDMPIESVKQLTQGRLKIGVSTHDLQQARLAEQAGADYIGCGPTFPSSTKQFEQFAGLGFLQEVAAEIKLPAYAIGGITANNIHQVRQAGLHRVAVSGAILTDHDPVEATREFKLLLN